MKCTKLSLLLNNSYFICFLFYVFLGFEDDYYRNRRDLTVNNQNLTEAVKKSYVRNIILEYMY